MDQMKLEQVIVENGMRYNLAKDGCYYPDFALEQQTNYPIGKYGIMRAEYMMEEQRHQCIKMMMEGIWNQYLHEVDEECQREMDLAVKRIMEKEGVTDRLKAENPLEWVRRVNGIKVGVEEQVVSDLLQ